jgi:probable HAF family extracellular repeat protein
MKSIPFSRLITLLLAITFAVPLCAQEPGFHDYKVVDLGSFGGGNSYGQGVFLPYFPGTSTVNNSGVVAAWGDTSVADPFEPFCYVDCLVGYGLSWANGSADNLGVLPQSSSLGPQKPCLNCSWSSFPLAISNSGLIAGETENDDTDSLTGGPVSLAALWKGGKIVNLGTLGGNESGAIGVNNWGDVVGGALTTTSETVPNGYPYYDVFLFGYGTTSHAFLWHDGEMHDLQTLGGPNSIALFVNDLGQIAGVSDVDSASNTNRAVNPGGPTVHPFLYEWGRMRDLIADAPADLFGGTYGIVSSLNNVGQVIGVMNRSGDQTWGSFLWERGSVKDLGTLGGTFTTAHWLNDSGSIVGRSNVTEVCETCGSNDEMQYSHPFLWKNNKMYDLGLPKGAQCATAKQINANGEVVGQSFLGVTSISFDFCSSSATGAFIWKNGSIKDLQSLLVPGSGITLDDSFNINEGGEILATGFLDNGDHRVVLLIPCE